MKKIIILSLIISLSSCELDGSFDKNGSEDRDDLNVIKKIGNQSLDKAINIYDTRSRSS